MQMLELQKETETHIEPENDGDDLLEVNGYKLHLPPMLFAADLMLLSLPDNRRMLSVNATDALYAWVAQVG